MSVSKFRVFWDVTIRLCDFVFLVFGLGSLDLVIGRVTLCWCYWNACGSGCWKFALVV